MRVAAEDIPNESLANSEGAEEPIMLMLMFGEWRHAGSLNC